MWRHTDMVKLEVCGKIFHAKTPPLKRKRQKWGLAGELTSQPRDDIPSIMEMQSRRIRPMEKGRGAPYAVPTIEIYAQCCHRTVTYRPARNPLVYEYPLPLLCHAQLRVSEHCYH